MTIKKGNRRNNIGRRKIRLEKIDLIVNIKKIEMGEGDRNEREKRC
jgi:hypothetical protein